MSRFLRLFLGLAIPSSIGLLLLAMVIPLVEQMPDIDPRVVLIMLGFIVSSVLSAVFTAFAFSGISFSKKRDVLLLYLNTYPWVIFIVLFFSRFWVLVLPILFTPLLGYWFAKRYFSL